MTTIEGDLNVFALALFLFFACFVVPALACIAMAWLTRHRDRRCSRWEDEA